MNLQQRFIRDVGAIAGIELSLDETETCSVAVDERLVTIKYRPDSNDWLIFGVIVDAGMDELPPETLSLVLEASLFGAKTKGFIPGRFGNALILSGRIPARPPNAEAFAESLVMLSTAIGELSNIVQGYADVPTANPPEPSEPLSPPTETEHAFLRV